MEIPVLLDARVLGPGLKHLTIFSTFDSLAEGQSLLLTNDHDPLSIHCQFKAERPGCFSWEYVANGPKVWQVLLTKTPAVIETVADLVRQNPAAATMFKKLNIDFCCKGNRLFAEVCAEVGLIPDAVKTELQKNPQSSDIPANVSVWPLDFLADYIVQNHHRYVMDAIPEQTDLFSRVMSVHGSEHPELETVWTAFDFVADELSSHMRKEERVLFPAIRQLVQAQRIEHPTICSFPFGSVADPIRMMEHEHTSAGDMLKAIRNITNNFTVPADGCYSFQLLYQKLEAFETDLHQHVHLENNILFPKAMQLEQALWSVPV